MKVIIDENGVVTPDVVLVDSTGLSPPVKEAARSWRFAPPTAKGVPVRAIAVVKISFPASPNRVVPHGPGYSLWLKCGENSTPQVDSSSAAASIGDAQYEKHDFEDATYTYQAGLALDPSNTKLREKLEKATRACTIENRGFQGGLSCGTNPAAKVNSPRTAIDIGDFHYRRGEYDDAIFAYRAGLALDPSNAVLRKKLKEALFYCGSARLDVD
jgi:hypothetical protein